MQKTLATLTLVSIFLGIAPSFVHAGGHGEQRHCCYGCDPNHGHHCQAYWEQRAANEPWNCCYYNSQWGSPVALVVPPTAEKYREMGWGVGNTRLRRIYPQFGRAYPGAGGGGAIFQATPQWPSDTTQFGVYYVRGPW